MSDNEEGEVWRAASMEVIHRVLVSGLAALDELARSRQAPYVLIAGSALGARRHAGPIPWDDDIDVCMERDAFSKFFTDVEHFPRGYAADTRSTDPMLGSDGKFYLHRTRLAAPYGDAHGFTPPRKDYAFIDVFCFYNASRHRVVRSIERALGWIVYIRPWAWRLASSRAPVGLRRRARCAIATVVPRGMAVVIERMLWRRSEQRDASLLGIGIGGVNGNAWYPRELVWPAATARFHELETPVPADLNAFLERTFGPDFMTPPEDVSDAAHGDFLTRASEDGDA